jgi:hypothetical protein
VSEERCEGAKAKSAKEKPKTKWSKKQESKNKKSGDFFREKKEDRQQQYVVRYPFQPFQFHIHQKSGLFCGVVRGEVFAHKLWQWVYFFP